LSDEIKKLDMHCESTVHKIASQHFELLAELKEEPKEFDVKGGNPQMFLTKFQWDKARFAVKKQLPELTRVVEVGVAKIDAELRAKAVEYNTVESKLRQIHQNTQGNLLTRDITKEIEGSKMQAFESKFLQSVYVVVPNSLISDWKKCYEEIIEYIVPRSSEELAHENDFSLFRVVIFKQFLDEFKVKCKERRFIVRKYEPTQSTSEVELGKLKQKHEKLRGNLIRWTATIFGEAYFLWVHLKSIQCYVESILRYGLPADFEVCLLLPKKEYTKNVEKALVNKYAHLERLFGDDDEEEEAPNRHDNEKYFPYVFYEIPVSF